jgi:hypothetical protein
MIERRKLGYFVGVLGAEMALGPLCFGAGKKVHVVGLAVAKKVVYSKAGDPSGAIAGEDSLKIRALVVDGTVKEWTTGEAHDVPIAALWCGGPCGSMMSCRGRSR